MAGIRIGFTGSRTGMTRKQKEIFGDIFKTGNNNITEFHHGCCVGADEEAHKIVKQDAFWVCTVIGHPPQYKGSKSDVVCDIVRPEEPFLDRNHAIVNETDQLIAAPDEPETLRSGTWATVRYARKQCRPITIIMPSGEVIKEK